MLLFPAPVMFGGAPKSIYPDISTYSYKSKSFSTNTQTTSAFATFSFFKPDGTKMYVGSSDDGAIFQYSLSTPWDVTTASYDSVSFATGETNTTYGVFLQANGSRVFWGRGNTTQNVQSQALSAAWDLSSATGSKNALNSGESSPFGMYFRDDGVKLFVLGQNADAIRQLTLSTPWIITSASFDASFSVSSLGGNPRGLWFAPDGLRAYFVQWNTDTIRQVDLTSAWDISTATIAVGSLSVGSQEGLPAGICMSPDCAHLYVTGGNNTVYQYGQ